MAKTIPEQDNAAARAYLEQITRGWEALPEPAMIELRCLFPDRTPDIMRFSPDAEGIDWLLDHAATMNRTGLNTYVVVNPVKASAPIRRDGRTSGAFDGDIIAALYCWADADTAEAAENIRQFAGPRYTMHVLTGTQPFPRPHVYWRLDEPCFDLAAWNETQRAIAATLSTDRAVVNPSRIMRLPGMVNWPTDKKAAKGYIAEVATFRESYADPRPPLAFERLQRAFKPATPLLSQLATPSGPPPSGGFQIDTGAAPQSLDRAAVTAQIMSGAEWHNNMVRLVASYVAKGLADHEIHALTQSLTLPGWTGEQTARDVQTAIDGARRKGWAPPPSAPEAQQVQAMQAQAEQAQEAAWPTQYDFFDEAALAPRQWIYGKHYLRRFVSVLASAGGIGKTSLQIVESLAICTGRPLLGEEVKEPCNVWLINLEDPIDEMQRRILAAMRHFGIQPDEVRGKLFVDAGRDFALTFAVQTREGVTPNTALVDHLVKRIPELQIGAVFIDPFVGAHQINENDNMAINAVVSQIRKVADETNCAIGLVHHIRKGNGEDATIDSVRGAGSLIGAARAARVINRVSADDAIKLGVNPQEALGIFRVDDGKANLAPPASSAVFRRMEGVQIANGEWVGVATKFDLPNEWEGMDDETVNEMLSIINKGIPDAEGNEEYYSIRPQDTDRWVGNVILQFAFDNPEHAKNKGQAKRIIEQWRKSNLIEEFEYRSVKQRKDRQGVRATGRVGEQK